MTRPSIADAIRSLVASMPKGADQVSLDLRVGFFPAADGKLSLQLADNGPIGVKLTGRILPRPELQLIERSSTTGTPSRALFENFDELAQTACAHPCRGWSRVETRNSMGYPIQGTLRSRDTDSLGHQLFMVGDAAGFSFKIDWQISHGNKLEDAIATLSVTEVSTGTTERWSGTKVDKFCLNLRQRVIDYGAPIFDSGEDFD